MEVGDKNTWFTECLRISNRRLFFDRTGAHGLRLCRAMSPWCFMLWRRLEESYFQDAQHDAEPVLEQISLVKAEAEGGGEGKAFFRGGELQTEAKRKQLANPVLQGL